MRILIVPIFLPCLFFSAQAQNRDDTVSIEAGAQSISGFLPLTVDTSQTYLFYLHGGVVQDQGIHAVSEYYGKYEYLAILDSLRSRGFQVISEARPKGTEVEDYAAKIAGQVDSLLEKGVSPRKIVIVGASLGAYMALEAAHRLQNSNVSYVLIGLCSEYAVSRYLSYGNNLYGNFLSIFERSDSKASCREIFKDKPAETRFHEIELNMGIDHAFLFKPYDEWVIPMVEWIEGKD
jgi:pimeloyl-ACP methyl ester carboxylesterase